MKRSKVSSKDLLGRIQALATEQDQAVHVHEIPPREARVARPSRPLSKEMQDALARMGITDLYTHQAQALDLIRDGKDVVIVTGTATTSLSGSLLRILRFAM